MKARRAASGMTAAALALTAALGASGCGASPHREPASAGQMPLPGEASASPRPDAHASWRDDDVPLAPRAKVDTSACDPAGKAIVVVGRDPDGHPNRWRYFSTRRGRRLLTCEAGDANGDGRVDARFFYDPSGRLVLEQRDLDFDGHAEIVADYSQFQPHRRIARAHALR